MGYSVPVFFLIPTCRKTRAPTEPSPITCTAEICSIVSPAKSPLWTLASRSPDAQGAWIPTALKRYHMNEGHSSLADRGVMD
jgi:hypothetical protein